MLKPGAVNVMLVKHTLRLSIVFYIRRREQSFVAIQLTLPPISVLSNNVDDITSFEGQLSVISSFKFVKPSASALKLSLGCYETKMRPGSLHSSACVTFRTHWSRSFINGGRCRCIGRIWCWKSQWRTSPGQCWQSCYNGSGASSLTDGFGIARFLWRSDHSSMVQVAKPINLLSKGYQLLSRFRASFKERHLAVNNLHNKSMVEGRHTFLEMLFLTVQNRGSKKKKRSSSNLGKSVSNSILISL